MLGLRHATSRSRAPAASLAARALSTSESLKVSSASPPAAAEERIKYFKIYRWDPDHRQKPVSGRRFVLAILRRQ